MESKIPTRRRFIQSAGVASTVILAGCSGNNNESDTPEEEDTPEEQSVFANYGIDGTELSVELTEDALEQVARIHLETPSGEKTTEVAETITEYSIGILRDRAGTWSIDALDSNGEVIKTVELETTFDFSVDELGTLAQLDVAGESPGFEEVNIQLTITNTGDVPIEPIAIQLVVPDLNYVENQGVIAGRSVFIGRDDEIRRYNEPSFQGGLVDGDGEVVIPTDSSNTYRSVFGNGASTPLVFEEYRANEIAGQSLQGEIVIMYRAEREDTTVPISIDMGDEVGTDYVEYRQVFLRGTVINER